MLIPHLSILLWITGIALGLALIGVIIYFIVRSRAKARYERAYSTWETEATAYDAAVEKAKIDARDAGEEDWKYAYHDHLAEPYAGEGRPQAPYKREYNDAGEGWSMFAWVFGIIGAAVGLITVLTFMPYDSKYHWLNEKSGTIESVEAVIMTDTETITQEFVVQFEGDDNIYLTDDTRILNYEAGDDIDIVWSVEWIQRGDDKLRFNIGSL